MTPSSTDAWTVADPTACPVCGRDSCEDHFPADATNTKADRAAATLHAVRALDLLDTPAPASIVADIANAGQVTVLPSESGAGKTYVVLDLGAAVSDDVPWHGRAVSPRVRGRMSDLKATRWGRGVARCATMPGAASSTCMSSGRATRSRPASRAKGKRPPAANERCATPSPR